MVVGLLVRRFVTLLVAGTEMTRGRGVVCSFACLLDMEGIRLDVMCFARDAHTRAHIADRVAQLVPP
jgi:hypothetical protein